MTTKEEVDMTTEENKAPEPKTFDLIAALAGRSYPTETIKIFLDEKAMYAYGQATDMALHDPGNKGLEKAIKELEDNLEEITYKVTVKGVPNHVLDSISESILEDYPVEKDPFGNVKEDAEADRAFHQKLWEAYVVDIEDPTGAHANLTSEAIMEFRKQAPESAIAAINSAVDKLREYSNTGYETVVKGLDF